MCRFRASTERGTEEINLFQVGELFPPVEGLEKIKASGARAESPHRRPHFRDPAGARERRFIHRDAERRVGRFDCGSGEKISGSPCAEPAREPSSENPSPIEPC